MAWGTTGDNPHLAARKISVFVNDGSSLHVCVRKQSGEEGVGLEATAYLRPVSKCLVRQVGQIKGLPSGESERAIIVCLMTGFLKLHEGRRDVY